MNRFVKKQKNISFLNKAVIPLVLFIFIFVLFFKGIYEINVTTEKEQFKATKQAVTRAVVHCYAIEGAYPPSIDYLEKKYGLIINHEKYQVDYNCIASNLMPDITVLNLNK